MTCQKCGKNNANVSYTRILNGEKMGLHLCTQCAKEMNLNINFSFGIDDMFSNFFDDFSTVRNMLMPSFAQLRGINEGFNGFMSDPFFEEIPFINDDLFFESNGISQSSKDDLDDVLNGIQKKYKSINKNEKEQNVLEKKKNIINKKEEKKISEINQLKAKIQEYIKKEEYEKAAVLRDKIKKLEADN